MTAETTKSAPAPHWTWGGLSEGAWRSAPMLPGTVVFSMVFGTIAAQKGVTLTDTVLMNALVFAGASQLVAIEVWSNPLTLGTLFSLATITAIVNARFILMGASLRPWLGPLPAWQAYLALLQNVDANWIVATRYRGEGGGDVSIYLGAGIALWVTWVASVIPGYLLGAFITDPTRFGFDMLLPVFFSAMTVQMWRGARRAVGWAVAGVVALAASQLIGGYWFIVIGAITGSVVGGFIDE
jgi:predicted branched-subunit amino acid permease